jgi:uncharacterized protein DUF5677
MDFDAEMRSLFERLPKVLVDELGEQRFVELMEKHPEKVSEGIRNVVLETTQEGGHVFAAQLRRHAPPMLAHRRAERRAFERQLFRRWKRAFDLAEMVVTAAFELGADFNAKHQEQANRENDLRFAVLVRLHARACRIAEEVLVLLKAGFGQAGLARWRVLHEVAVVASFIADHDQDTAERYLLHENIEAWRGMQEYQARVDRLNIEPFTDNDLREGKRTYDELVTRYGKPYASQYGWAQKALADDDARYVKARVTLAALERAVSLDHMRPYYRLSSHGVHANPKGILFTPDLAEGAPEVLLAGPTNTGLADAGQCTLLSLNLATSTLLMYKRGEAAGLTMVALLDLVAEAAEVFVRTQSDIENDRRFPRFNPVAGLRDELAPPLTYALGRVGQHIGRARVSAGRRLRGRWLH